MSNGLLYIAGLISLALAALFAVPYFIDWNGYRGVFEEEATRILGREVRVGGNVNLRLLPSPYVSFEKLRIADPTGATGEPFFRAESFTMRLSAPPLLKGIIEANEVVLEKPVLRLAVDAEGAGNWRSFSISSGSLPFVPAGVTLQSVKINDGAVTFHGPRGISFADLSGLNGELKAESASGPFAFKGTTQWRDEERELRLVTGMAEADGSMRFKATVRGTGGDTSTYSVDGRVADIKNTPRVDGELTAKLALATDPLAPAGAAVSASGKQEAPLLDFRAHIDGDAKGLRVENIAVAFEHVGQPQLISGSANATWDDALSVNMDLASRWLDLDRVTTSEEGGDNPIVTARNFIMAMMAGLPKNADSKVRFDLDQASLGGEPVSGVQLEVARSGGTLLLNKLRVALPGGTRLALDGTVADAANGQSFRGDVTLHGTSLTRFLDWAAHGKALADGLRNEGPFSLQGQLAMSEGGIHLTEAGAEIGGRPLTGEMHYANKDRPYVEVALDGAEIDAGQFWPAGVEAFKRVVAPNGTAEAPAAPAKFAWFDPAAMDLDLRVRAGELLAGGQRLRNVNMDIGIVGGRLAVRSYRFATAEGLKMELEGDVADATTNPHGTLRWTMNAPTAETYGKLIALIDPPEDVRAQAETFSSLAPMRIAGALQLGVRQPGAADVTLDGSAQGGGRVVANAMLDGGFGNWRAAPADISFTVDSTDVSRIVASLSARGVANGPSIGASMGASQAGQVFVKAVGTPAKGMTVSASAQAPALFFGYDGNVVLPGEGGRGLDGDLRISARALSEAMAVAGLGGGVALSETPVVGTLHVSSTDNATELKLQDLSIGGSKVGGSLALAYPSEGPAIVTGELTVDDASVPGLLRLVLDRKPPAELPGAEPLTAGKSIWPEHAFDFAALDGIEGKLGVSFGTLTLAERMVVPKARAEVTLEPGKVEVSKLEGKVLGGDLSGRVMLERAPGGASLDGALHIADMHVRKATAGASATETKDPQASLALDFKSRASTPGALVSVATGKGEVKLGELSLHVPTPFAVVAASNAALSGEAGATGEQLAEALRAQFDAADVAVGPRDIPIEIADGAAKLALVTLASDAGTTKVETTVDLASLIVDSAWVIEPRAPDVPQQGKPRLGALPSVGVVYTGRLADAWALTSRITSEPLERELAIRKMELDADQLERLHQADAERARRDEERRRSLESDEGSAPLPVPPAPRAVPSMAPSPTGGNAVSIDPETSQSVTAAPAVPPSSASAPGVVVPPAPGQEGQTFGAAPTDALEAPMEAGSITPPPAATPSGASYRPRRTQRHIQPNEEVLRNLQNTN